MRNYDLPPVIRVFLSSTFADMEKERSYFNEALVPKLNNICAERGVSFFSIDLRWGITEEEQVDGKVLPICLGEIDKCRPFFIGILGNRYGSLMEQVPAGLGESIPWLMGKEGRSITELEMLYAVLDKEKNTDVKNCVFLFRDDTLSAEWYQQSGAEPRLAALKEIIRADERVPSPTYRSLEEFGELVMKEILGWLDREFPAPDQVSLVRRQWYDRELLRNFIPLPEFERFLDQYLEQTTRPLLLCGEGARGKTTLLTAWQPKSMRKILINCGSDDLFLYWPSVAKEIIDKITELEPSVTPPTYKTPRTNAMSLVEMLRGKRKDNTFFFASDEDRETFRAAFVGWLADLQLSAPLCIVINDTELQEDERSRLLAWLPPKTTGAVRIILSTNNADIRKNAEALGWNTKEVPLFPKEQAGALVENHLKSFGKSLASHQMKRLMESCVTAYPGQLRFVTAFLIECGRFHNLDRLIDGIAACKEAQEVYRYIYDYSVAEFSEKERQAASTLFGLLNAATGSLTEQDCYAVVAGETGVSAIEWAAIRGVFERFGLVRGDYWNMREEALRRFTQSLLTKPQRLRAEELLAEHYYAKLSAEKSPDMQWVREQTGYARSALQHCCRAEKGERLMEMLGDPEILQRLVLLDWRVVRVCWMWLFLHTELDLPAALFGLLKKFTDDVLRRRIAGLFCDLGYRALYGQVTEALGNEHYSESFGRTAVSGEFVKLYAELNQMKNAQHVRPLLERVTALLEQGGYDLTETCYLLFFKADCENLLGLEDLTDTCNRYYEAALRAGEPSEIIRALSLRGNDLYTRGQIKEAADVHGQVSNLALREGMLHSFLGANNALALSLNRMGDHAGAVEAYQNLYRWWMRMCNEAEAVSTRVNHCNALYAMGDVAGALKLAEEVQNGFPDATGKTLHNKVSLLSNMGLFRKELGDPEGAERDIKEGIRLARELGMEPSLIRALSQLASLYLDTERVLPAVEVYEEMMELYWARKEYTQVLEVLKKAEVRLYQMYYTNRAKALHEKWKDRFRPFKGGLAFFDETFNKQADSRSVDQLTQQLAVATSEGDTAKAAELNILLAQEYVANDPCEAVRKLLDAAELLADDPNKRTETLYYAVALLFDDGILKDERLLKTVLAQLQDPAAEQVVQLWEQFGKTGQKDRRFAALLKFVKADEKSVDLKGCIARLAELVPATPLALRALSDVAQYIVNESSADQLIALTEQLPQDARKEFSDRLAGVLLKDNQQGIDRLKNAPTGDLAEEGLAFYEKVLSYLLYLDHKEAAAIAGNLALIYRRRKDREKTIRYHNISMERYRQQGLKRDELIEWMNVATAYREFGQLEDALTQLRQGIKLAEEAGERSLQASMAGNLASLLMDRKDPNDRTEILACFAIEEELFRSMGADRDLIISLMNQMVFAVRSGTVDDTIRAKMQEAKELAHKNSIHEFDRNFAVFDQQFNRADSAVTDTELQQTLEQLLQAQGKYQVHQSGMQEGALHLVCVPTKPDATENEILHLLINPKEASRLMAVAMWQPKQVRKDTDYSGVHDFVAWWNGQGDYQLDFNEKDAVLRAQRFFIMGEGLADQFALFCALWATDRAAASMLCLGMNDQEILRNAKLKLLED